MAEKSRPVADVQQDVLAWIEAEPRFAQVYTVNKDGYPTGRTMGARLRPDWTVELVQGRQGFDRVEQARRHPQMEILWVDNHSTQVVPKCVFVRGDAQLYEGDELLAEYATRYEANARRGRAGERWSDERVLEELIGIRVQARRVRVEGFGERSEVFIWTV